MPDQDFGQDFRATMAPRNIVPFETYHTAMTQPAHAHIRNYWEGLRAGRLMPLRAEVDPREMSPYLEHCFVLQHAGPGDTRFRLAGMAINEVMGMELRGMPLRSIIVPEERGLFSAQLEQTFTTPEIQEFRLVSDQPNVPRLNARLLILPLSGDDANSDRAIGCLTTDGAYGLPPRRFRIEDVLRTSLTTGERLTTSTQASPKAAAPAPQNTRENARENAGFAEAAEPFTTDTAVPYLRVVK